MSLYYQDDLIELHHGDAREIPQWTDADVLVTDPPYGMSYSSGRREQKAIVGDGDLAVRDDVLAMWGTRPALQKAPEGIIADPFAGSGSTLLAARNLGRRAIGVEIEESYCELIVKRLSQQAFDFGGI